MIAVLIREENLDTQTHKECTMQRYKVDRHMMREVEIGQAKECEQ